VVAQPLTLRQELLGRLAQLENERASWIPKWQDLTTYILPWSGRYFLDARNRGTNGDSPGIYDNTATDALFTLAAGLMAGATSPARPWFRLKTGDSDLDRFVPVREWCDEVAKRMRANFQSRKSNTYRVLHQMYLELGCFGTSSSVMLPAEAGCLYHYPMTLGEYCLSSDSRGRIDTFYREFNMTARAMVQQFGIDRVSPAVRNAYERNQLEATFTVLHAIEPRSDRKPGKADAQNMEWRSIYLERSAGTDILRESGFDYFPVLAPRWSTFGGDVYGNSPGMRCLGDIMSLQQEQLRKGQAIDFMTSPSLQAPVSMKNKDTDLFPGGISFVDSPGQKQAMSPVWQPNLNLRDLSTDMMEVRQRIDRAFCKDLFLLITNSNDAQKTVPEIEERREEKMMVLGPLLESLQTEMQEPLIAAQFRQMLLTGTLPPPPEELNGIELQVEFNGVLAQAQVAIGMNSVDRFTATLGHMATFKPEVLDKFNADEWADYASDTLGVPARMIVGSDQVAIVRQKRAAAQAAKDQAEAMDKMGGAAQKLAAAPTGGTQPTALTDLLNQYSGYGSPTAAGVA
jgi:hypothetical protein